MRRVAFYLLEVITIFFVLTASQAVFGCEYIRHDHYKNNYRIRHKHKICESVAAHYQDDPLRLEKLYLPDLYLSEDEEDTTSEIRLTD